MRIKSITYINHCTGWNIRDLNLGRLTLLVGASGVGKTQILRAISNVCEIAKGESFNGVEWNVSFTNQGSDYIWSGCFETKQNEDVPFPDNVRYAINYEKLLRGEDEIIDRDSSRILFEGKETVKLDNTKSAVSLLASEQLVFPVRNEFAWNIYQIENEDLSISVSPVMDDSEQISIDEIYEFKFLDPIERLFLLKKRGLKEFDLIKEGFIDIFPQIEDIDFTTGRLYDDKIVPILTIKERGVERWIKNNLSAGMLRTLRQLTTLVLAQDGNVVLIDEFENGLGVNCIDILADQINNSEKDIQYILTSHHPYIINNIPFENWRVVVRDKSDVSVMTAEELNIGTRSKHDAFMQLIQTEAYKTGKR